MGATLIIAHRGASADARENSIEAFDRAIAVGAEMIEFDVRRTRDDQLIAYHDAAVGEASIGALTREEIGARSGHVPPLLDEVLDLARGRVGLDIELKETGYVDLVLSKVDTSFGPRDLVITSFLDTALAEVKRIRPDVETGLLLGVARPAKYVRTRFSELFPAARARRCHADYIAPHVDLARLGALRRGAAAGLEALVWTVNDAEGIGRCLADPRVAGVITDVPCLALQLRDGTAPAESARAVE